MSGAGAEARAADPPAGALQASPTRAPGESGGDAAVVVPTDSHPSLWQTLKSFVGKDLSRVSLPVWLNEPLSFLQRAAEDVEYSELLDRAAACDDALERAALVAAFAVSHYSSTLGRHSKPFNPLLGETFEMVCARRGLAFVAEQVSHHPPMSAVHVAGRGWTYETTHALHNRFLGNKLEVWPEGRVHVRLHAANEHYVYEQCRTTVHNIVVGQVWLENAGTMTIREVTRGRACATLRFKRYAMLFGETKNQGEVSGRVSLRADAPSASSSSASAPAQDAKLAGNWGRRLALDGRVLWEAAARPPAAATAGYGMTSWGWGLNCPAGAGPPPAPTDSRFRPDQRALERGEFKAAGEEKERLEQKQREARLAREATGVEYDARWFELADVDGVREWRYRGGYFAARPEWPHDLPDIY